MTQRKTPVKYEELPLVACLYCGERFRRRNPKRKFCDDICRCAYHNADTARMLRAYKLILKREQEELEESKKESDDEDQA